MAPSAGRPSMIFWVLAACSFASQAHAQAGVWHQGIQASNVDLRGAPVSLSQITVDLPSSGRVIVQFDGQGLVSVGDRIVLAASDTPDWGINDGNVDIEAYNADQDTRPFSHTRSYLVGAGEHTFYAVGQNYVEEGGTGFASIYGSLTVKFYPDTGTDALARHLGIAQTSVDLRGSDVTLGQISIVAPTAGRAVVRFDGGAVSSPGDRLVLAANDAPTWEVNNGHASVEAFDSDLDASPFAHTRVFDIGAGAHTFYAVGRNYVEEDGTGIASVYGSLTVEFFPLAANEPSVEHADINAADINLRGSEVTLSQIDFEAAVSGTVLLRFDGYGIADVGDRLVLAASDTASWGVNDGNVSIEAVDADVNRMSFSHSRAFDVDAGTHSFFAVGQNYVEEGGSGLGSVYGRLTLQFFPVPEPQGAAGALAAILALGMLRGHGRSRPRDGTKPGRWLSMWS